MLTLIDLIPPLARPVPDRVPIDQLDWGAPTVQSVGDLQIPRHHLAMHTQRSGQCGAHRTNPCVFSLQRCKKRSGANVGCKVL